VTDTTKEGSAENSSRFEITTGEDMIGQPIPVRCVVEQRFEDREVSQKSSTAQLTVISPTSKCVPTLANLEQSLVFCYHGNYKGGSGQVPTSAYVNGSL